MALLPFRRRTSLPGNHQAVAEILDGFSMEVMPRTAAKVLDFQELLPPETRIYLAHIEGTPIDEMVASAARLRGEGFAVMPHFPARIIADRAELAHWIERYRDEADVREALVLGGGPKSPRGAFGSSMQLLETELFEAAGFTRLHVAGHPEGNRDIDPDGGNRIVDEALLWKQDYARQSPADMAIVTQFAFDAAAVLSWADRLAEIGITMPIHVGIAGPAKLHTMLKFAIACGVGPSLAVLQRRARDVTNLLLPFEPNDVLRELADGIDGSRGALIENVHVFPLGGIEASAGYLSHVGASTGSTASVRKGN